jgi:hypothetical protein
VHLPHGYDGIERLTQLQLIQAARNSPGPVYVHCHHGQHRGPAAAAVIGQEAEGWTAKQAEAWLHLAGTSSNYPGLFAAIEQFRRPTAEELRMAPHELPEIAKVSGLVETMVRIDQRWEHLRAVRQAGYHAPREHPDIDPVSEAVMLWELYREAQRLPEAGRRGPEFVERLKTSETEARQLEALLRTRREASPNSRVELDHSFDRLAQTCASCHRSYRDHSEGGGVRRK